VGSPTALRDGQPTLPTPRASRAPSPATHHRGRVWEPFEGSHVNIAWAARRLGRRRTIAGGFGNPSRVPMSTSRGQLAGSAGDAPSREGLGTLRGFPCQHRVGSSPARPATHHRGRVWEPFEGSHVNIAWAARRLGRRRTIAGGFGNPSRVPMSMSATSGDSREPESVRSLRYRRLTRRFPGR